jgi:GT2 family glycosyltransferase
MPDSKADTPLKLSIVILCWNDWKVINECLRSIFSGDSKLSFEVIVSDNGSTDGCVEFIRRDFEKVQLIENKANLGFARGNNVGINAAKGEFVLILNPDTIIHKDSLYHLTSFAEQHPEAGGFGCRVENPDGSYQASARPFPTIFGGWIAALYLRPLAYLSPIFTSDTYTGWKGNSVRSVDWQSGCCLMVRRSVLQTLEGFDERFFYNFEEVDLCMRIWKSGKRILFTPDATITHLGGQSVKRFPSRFEIEKCRNRYRFFYKHYGAKAARSCRSVLLAHIRVRQFFYGLKWLFSKNEILSSRLKMYRLVGEWNKKLDPISFVETGIEPNLSLE